MRAYICSPNITRGMMNKYDLYYQVTLEKLHNQEALHTEFGTKASNMLTFGAALIGVGAVVLRFSESDPTPSATLSSAFVLLMLAFLSTAGWSLYSLWPRNWEHSPKAGRFAEHLASYDDNVLTEWVGDEYGRSVESNRSVLEKKANALRWGMVSLAGEALMVAVLGFLLVDLVD